MPAGPPYRRLVESLARALTAATRPLRPWRGGVDGRLEIALPHRWRPTDRPIWFRYTLPIDEAWRGRDLLLHLDVAEGLLHVNGAPYHGLDRQHRDVVLPGVVTSAAAIDLAVEATRAAPFGGAWFREARVGPFDAPRHRLLHQLASLRDLLVLLPAGEDRDRVEEVLAQIERRLDAGRRVRDDGAVSDALATIAAFTADPGPSPRRRGQVHVVGHSHIDVVWLWTLAETRRKCARTFSTALRLMERYPGFCFAQSQAQLYEFVKHDYPEIYAQVRERVREGRWEPVGCTWVEPDCNIPNGESLVRQIVYGRRFFAQEFGAAGDTLWLPDTFGYAWSLPQILRLSGIRAFFTTKLLWNDTSAFPHHSFWWEGIDGSRVLAHNPPVGLEGLVTPQHLAKSWSAYAERARSGHVLQTFGYGDGGGGVTAEQLDVLPLYAAAPGMPSCAQTSVTQFFAALAREGRTLPVWRDELYLELHRGTYTTHAWLKRANRHAESMLYVTDLLCAMAGAVTAGPEWADPGPRLELVWKRLLLNQFHDIVPGTAVEAAYEDTRLDFADIEQGCEALQREALGRVLPAVPEPAGPVYTVFNPLGWNRTEHLELPAADGRFHAVDGGGRACRSQHVQQGHTHHVVCEVEVPAMGCAHVFLRRGQAGEQDDPAGPDGLVLESPRLAVRFDERGAITSLVDRVLGHECVLAGRRLNEFQAFRDEPARWEAWDLDPDYASKPVALFTTASAHVLERGPLRWRLRVLLQSAGPTRLEQDIVLHRDSPRIDFRTRVLWRERRTLLKVAFPLAVAASRATYEIPFGAIARPTEARTPRERGRWEVAGQQWTDLSERTFGVSLLNDSKYGYDCQGSTLRLTLIRSPHYPHHAEPMTKTSARVTDQGEHRFTYALLPHAGSWREGETVRHARELNVPVLTMAGRRELALAPLLRLEAANVQISSIAPSVTRPGHLIVRLYECHGAGGRAGLQVGPPLDEVREVDLEERPGRRLSLRNGRLDLRFRPFQIRTLRLTPCRAAGRASEETHDH
jgi:alpha-mannosidase